MDNKGRRTGSPYNLGEKGGVRKLSSSPRTPIEKSNYDLNKCKPPKGD